MPQKLPVLDHREWTRVLACVAHPDDMEYGTSAAVAEWTKHGITVSYLLMTAGEAGMAEAPEVIAPLREREQQAACAEVGVSDLEILGYPDGMLEYGLDLRRDLARAIRKKRPHAVITANFALEAYGGLNQADHRAAGLSVIDAVRDAANPWIFRELLEDEGLQPWQVSTLLVAGDDHPTHGVEVTEPSVKAAVRSLEAHEAYMAHVVGHPKPAEFIPQILQAGGEALGVPNAVVFRAYQMG